MQTNTVFLIISFHTCIYFYTFKGLDGNVKWKCSVNMFFLSEMALNSNLFSLFNHMLLAEAE